MDDVAENQRVLSVDCSAKIDHLAKFSALPVPGREPEGVRGEVDDWPRFEPPLNSASGVLRLLSSGRMPN